jgi:hypothetical protein
VSHDELKDIKKTKQHLDVEAWKAAKKKIKASDNYIPWRE